MGKDDESAGKPQSSEKKMIPESDLIAFKESAKGREARLKSELENLKSQIKSITSELEIAKATAGGDEEVEKVKQYLKQKAKELDDKEKDFTGKVSSLSEREKKARARELVTEYKSQGVDIDTDELLEQEDMEKFALSKHAAFLAEENKKLKEKPPEAQAKPGQPIYETGVVATKPKQPNEMSKEEFQKHVESLKQEALSRK